MLNKKIVQSLCYYIVPLLMLLAFVTQASFTFFIFLGELAIHWLFFVLMLKPLSLIFTTKVWKKLLGFRREFGVLIFWMVFFHGIEMWFYAGYEAADFFTTPPFFYGLLGGLGIFVLGITSNKLATRLLKKNWKTVQLIAYPTLFFALFHAALISGRYGEFIVLSLVYVGLKVWAYIVQKNKRHSPARKNAPSF